MSEPGRKPVKTDTHLAASEWPEVVQKIRQRTPARILVGRAGAGYRTTTELDLRQAHALAVDAVRAELDITRDLPAELVEQWKLFEVSTCVNSKSEFLLRPDLGRRLSPGAREQVAARCQPRADLQIVVGDGLSVSALEAQVPQLLPLLARNALELGWRVGQSFVIRYCRVGVLNEIGDLLAPKVAVLLIGERPGLATAESLSAYMAFQPRAGHTDADRNLVSNIHARGVSAHDAANRILGLAQQMLRLQMSGTHVKEVLPATASQELTGH